MGEPIEALPYRRQESGRSDNVNGIQMTEHEVHVDGAEGSRAPYQSRPLPLNSRRLTVVLLKQLAKGLEVPDTGSSDEIRQLIEGKLGVMGRDPRNVQVLLQETERGGAHLGLQDAEGVFLEVEPESPAEDPPPGASIDDSRGGDNPEGELDVLRQALTESQERNEALESDVRRMQEELAGARDRIKELWRMNCLQLSEFDAALSAKEEELTRLKERLRHVHPPRSRSPTATGHESDEEVPAPAVDRVRQRRGRAPPVDPFSGENPELHLEDWLPALQRASAWYGWCEEELLLQLAGHLRGWALQEWTLLSDSDKTTMPKATEALRARLDPGSKAMAAQDFRHTTQPSEEDVASYIRRLERMFRIAYGRDGLTAETRDALLYSQLHEGLRYELMCAPAVSGAQAYLPLCVAAKSEERRLSELKKRQQYQKPSTHTQPPRPNRVVGDPDKRGDAQGLKEGRKCYVCGKPGHFAAKCKMKKGESTGRTPPKSDPKATHR